ncbi:MULTISPECIES: hypothetical protein [Pectobacterium]|uniref:hypothetical protein n=1 Tax=Pectobacterium TaxID=122277 RepID=UPI0004FFB281|nr:MULTISPECIES: hypothetical protein [Pectobacterium]KFX10147.1 hypothetical protein KP17_20200 [Pectobacterium parvum]GKW36707.1 hypothetical protein PEC301875_07310 [Pectobacterium carotovorum subsp. carotovorum]
MDKEKVEMLIKILTRTDGYLNYANTKSTILLTLASAVLATAGINLSKLLPLDIECLPKISFMLFSFFLMLGVFLSVISVVKSLNAMSPYLKESKKENLFSFVDVVYYNKNENDYSKKLLDIENNKLINQLSSLNYNLSHGVIGKYKNHKLAIIYLKLSMLSFLLSLVFPWFGFLLDFRHSEMNVLVVVILLCFLLILIVFILFFIILFLLFTGKGKE